MKNKEMLWNDSNVKIHEKIHVIGQVYISDYNHVKNAEGQRSLEAKGVKQLSDSISTHGICSCPLVVKNKNKYIVVDGWHRISVAKKNNMPVICTLVKPNCTINELMIILNTTQLNWNIEAFLNNGIVYHKSKDYVELRQIWEDTAINLGALREIYCNDTSPSRVKELFDTGEWVMTTKPLANKTIRYIGDINPYIPFSYKTNFIRAFIKCVNKKGFKIEQLISQCKKFPNHIHDFGDSPIKHMEMINKLYNHCALEEEQVYLGK